MDKFRNLWKNLNLGGRGRTCPFLAEENIFTVLSTVCIIALVNWE